MSVASARSTAALSARSGADSERTYRRALRHSRLVRGLRVTLLAAIAILFIGLVVADYVPSVTRLSLPTGIGKFVIRGTEITMQKPHLTGYTSDSRPYQFSAESAAQDITKPDIVKLHRLRAEMAMADNSTVHLWADDGRFNMKTQMLTLNDNIRLVSSTGYEARLSHTVIDMNKGRLVSDSPVSVKMLSGNLRAKRLEITDKGGVARFADVTLTLESRPPTASPTPGAKMSAP